MPNVTLSKVISATIGGVVISGTTTRTRSGETPTPLDDNAIPAGKVGSLTTRTDNDTGVATMVAGHGFVTNDVVDVYWDGGVRYNMTATVATNAVTVDGGAGDNLPAQATALVVSLRRIATFTFDPAQVQLLAAKADQRASIRFMATAVVAKALDLASDEVYSWVADDDDEVDPIGTDPITAIHFSSGYSGGTNRVRVGQLLDTVP